MRRRLFMLLSMLSLLLCVTTCALWVRSYYIQDDWQYWHLVKRHAPEADFGDSDHYFEINLYTNSDQFMLRWEDPFPTSYDETLPQWNHSTFRASPLSSGGSLLNYFGFDFYISPHKFGGGDVAAPMWFAAILTSACPVTWVITRARRRRIGLCRVCGYDLRATPHRCPECGAAPDVPGDLTKISN